MTQSDEQRIAQLEEDNRRLRRLLEDRHAPAELRHRLRSTLALLRSIVRTSAQTSSNVATYAARIEDRLDAVASAQTSADVTGEIEIGGVIAETLRRHGAPEGRRSNLSGPLVFLQPRAGQIFALAINELALNALEHGSPSARIDVRWDVQCSGAALRFLLVWKEQWDVISASENPPGFGSGVLSKLLPYELQATTDWSLQPDGLRCTIEFELTDVVGRYVQHSDRGM